jgi:hypothetical protein
MGTQIYSHCLDLPRSTFSLNALEYICYILLARANGIMFPVRPVHFVFRARGERAYTPGSYIL